MSRLIPKKQTEDSSWAQPANTYFPQGEPTYNGGTLPDVDITAKPMSKARKAIRKALNTSIMVPAVAPNATSIATWLYNPSNLILTTPKEELNYLAGMAAPFFPLASGGYFLANGIEDIAENRANVGNVAQVGLSVLPLGVKIAPYAEIAAVRGVAKTPIGKRAAEVVMRMSSGQDRLRRYSNISNEIKKNFQFILTGNRNKAKFGSNGGLFVNDPWYISDRQYYNILDDAALQGDDLIGAYLYKNKINPRFAKRIPGKDYGIHTDYIKQNYKGKDIPVYEVGPSELLPNLETNQIEDLVNGKSISLGNDVPSKDSHFYFNVAGHRGYIKNIDGKPMFLEQDIWKFNPEEYMKKWINSADDYYDLKELKRHKIGAHFIDAAGTPVITRTEPVDISDLINAVNKKKQGGRLIPKGQNGLKEQRAAENQRHNTLAKHYVLHPTLPNLAKAAYHWWKGTPGLGGQFENDYIVKSGIAPLPGDPSIEAIKKAEAIATATKAVGPSANVSKTISNSVAMEKGARGTVKRLTKSNLTSDPDILNLREYPQYETAFNKIARKLFMSNDPVKNKEYFKLIGDLVTRFKNGIK